MSNLTHYDFEAKVRKDLSEIYNTTQPELLASNDLGFLINFFSHLRYDVRTYLDTLYNENNPALATKYSSLFFHASMSNYDIEFSSPAEAKLIIIIPKRYTQETRFTYTINEGDKIVSDSGVVFTMKYTVVISIIDDEVQAYYKSSTEHTKFASVDTIPSQEDPNKELFIINLPTVAEQSETTTTFIKLPFYEYRTTLNITIPQRIGLEELKSLDIFLLPAESDIDAIDLINEPMEILKNNIHLEKLTTSFDPRTSTTNNSTLMIDTTDELTMVFGDGISSRKFNEGDTVIIRTVKTKGSDGNQEPFMSSFNNVPVAITYDGYTVYENSSVDVLFPDGAINGKTIDNVYDLRSKIVEHIFRRDSLVSEQDYKIFFEKITGNQTVINAFSATNSRHLIAYSPLKDSTNKIIKTNTFDTQIVFPENELVYEMFMDDNPKSPEFMSPLYIKQHDKDQYAYGYIIRDEVQFGLGFTYEGDNQKHIPLLFLKYNFQERKLFIDLREDNGASYHFSSSHVEGDLTEDNDYILYIDPYKTHDKYCFLEETLTDCKLTDTTNGIEYTVSDVTMMKEVQKFLNFYFDDNTRFIGRIPFVETTDFNKYGYPYITKLLDDFFISTIINQNNLFDLHISQSVANTHKFEDPYSSIIVEYNDNFKDIQPAVTVILDLSIDMDAFVKTQFETMNDFQIELQLYLSKLNIGGFTMEFNELDIERKVQEQYPFILNVRSNLNSFKFKNEPQILRDINENLRNKKLMYNYTPFYFWIDKFVCNILQR